MLGDSLRGVYILRDDDHKIKYSSSVWRKMHDGLNFLVADK